jgi:hypothetical protein
LDVIAMTPEPIPTAGPEGPALHDGPSGPALRNAPSGRRIALATAGALLVAAAVLAVAVLPAEYGIDPLGTGKALGLLDLYSAAGDASNAPPIAPAADAPPMTMYNVDAVVFTLRPSEGFEYKYRIEKGGGLVYAWTATRAVKYEFHGEHDGARPGVAVSYEKAEGAHASGSFTAPASGIHGWYWENPSDDEMTITLTSSGFYRWADEFRQHFDPVKHKGVVERVRHELSAPPSP